MPRLLIWGGLLLGLLACSPSAPTAPTAAPQDEPRVEASPLVPVLPRQVGREVDAAMQQESRQLEQRVDAATDEP